MIEPLRRDIEQLIKLTAVQLGLNVQLALKQCEVESSFNFRAANPSSGCLGLFQVSKVAEKDLNERIIKRYADRFDFLRGVKVKREDWRSNIFAGLMYMRYLIDHFKTVERALAAYNLGIGKVDDLVEKHGPNWWARIPRETGEYLQKILGAEAPNAHVDYKAA